MRLRPSLSALAVKAAGPATLIALALVACESGGGDSSYVTGSGSSAVCSQQTTCGACTPVLGCGWCYNSDGTGTCAASPDQCPTQVFTWTWNPDGCLVLAEAGVAAEEAQAPVLDGSAETGTDGNASADSGAEGGGPAD
jgi:hypothetical protein